MKSRAAPRGARGADQGAAGIRPGARGPGPRTLTAHDDVLSKTSYVAPFDGVVTNLPVREGETVVIGIQNSPGSTLMTIADMSVITAEVKVDETDIVNVKLGQPADVTIDAIPNKIFKGKVTRDRQQGHHPLHRHLPPRRPPRAARRPRISRSW